MAVTFSYPTWVLRYPEFAGVAQDLAQEYFNEAETYWANCGWTAAVRNAPIFLNMLTAHIAWLYAPRDASGNPASSGAIASSLVGRISSAAEGSVNVATELSGSEDIKAFFAQTKYGLSFWQATSQFRLARYVAHPTIVANGVYPYRGRFFGRFGVY